VAISVQREELLRLVGELPEEEVPAVLDDVRRHLRAVHGESWPPAWFGAGDSTNTDVAARSEELLDEGFGRSACSYAIPAPSWPRLCRKTYIMPRASGYSTTFMQPAERC
jgi:hypothetical protein